MPTCNQCHFLSADLRSSLPCWPVELLLFHVCKTKNQLIFIYVYPPIWRLYSPEGCCRHRYSKRILKFVCKNLKSYPFWKDITDYIPAWSLISCHLYESITEPYSFTNSYCIGISITIVKNFRYWHVCAHCLVSWNAGYNYTLGKVTHNFNCQTNNFIQLFGPVLLYDYVHTYHYIGSAVKLRSSNQSAQNRRQLRKYMENRRLT